MNPEVSFADDVVAGSDRPLDAVMSAAVCDVPAKNPPKSLKRRAIDGSVWTFVGYGGSQLIRFGANILLTRLLFPRAFGLMALINVLMQGLQMFSDLGIAPAIMKHGRTEDPEFFNTAWTMQVIRGFALWLVACALAAPAAWFWGTPMLATMIPVAALTALISGFTSTKLFIEGRDLRLARVVGIEVASQVVAVAVMILLAKYWGSVWALVLGGLLGTLVKVVLSHIALPGMKNWFCLHRESLHHLYHFGRWIFVSTVFTFLAMQIDRLLLARLVSLEMLGKYSIALGLVSIVIGVFEQFSNRILMPAMAHVKRKSHQQFNEVVSKSRRYVLSVAAVAVANMILLAPAFFYVLYDSRYHEAGLIARWLGFGLWFTLLQRTSQASLLALGHSKALALANATNFLVTIISAPIGFHFLGMEGFILGWTLGNLVAVIIVDMALERDGIPLLRQDAILTIGLLSFLVIGFQMRSVFQVHDVWTVQAWQLKLLTSAVLTLASAAIIYWDFRRSSAAHSGAPNIELNGMVNGQPESAAAILTNGAVSGAGGRVVSEVSRRD